MKLSRFIAVTAALAFLCIGGLASSANALVWETTYNDAQALAKQQGKMILLVGGDPLCERTKYMKNQVCELTNPNIRGLIQQYYVPFYAGSYGERSAFSVAGSLFPLVCIIDPNDKYGIFKDRTTENMYTYTSWDLSGPQAFYDRLLRYAKTSTSCSFTISPTSKSFNNASRQTGTVTVGALSSCAWTASSNASWITITAGTSGAGNGAVAYTVAANTTGGARTGTMTIAGKTFTVTQSGATMTCTFSISPSSALFEAEARQTAMGPSGNKGRVDVSTSSECTWSAESHVDWITITAGDSGAGDGSVYYTVADNLGISARTGTLTIAGKTFTVKQKGPHTLLYFPHVATGDPWQTEIALINTSDETLNGTLKGLDAEGEVVEEMVDVELPAHGRKQLDVAGAFEKHADIGYIAFEAQSDAVQGYTKLAQEGICRTAIPAEKGGAGPVEGVLAKIEKNGGWTGIVFVNTESDAASVELKAYDDAGAPVATRTITIAPRAKMIQFPEEIFSEDISGATYLSYSSDRYIVGFHINGSGDGKMLDGLPGL